MRWYERCCGCGPSGSSSMSETHALGTRSGHADDEDETVAIVSQTTLSSPPITASTTIIRDEGTNHREKTSPSTVTPVQKFYYSPGHIYHTLPTTAISEQQTDPPPLSFGGGESISCQTQTYMDGAMLLRPCKSVLFVTSNLAPGSSEYAFIQRLKSSSWSIHRTVPTTAKDDFHKYRPVVVLLDSKLSNLKDAASSLHSLPETEDVLFGVLCDRALSDKRRKALENEFHQFFLATSTDISLCEFFAKISARLRAIPALFAVVEEAEQPIKICDESNIVQYVNRAYEHVSGVSRSEVLGKDSSEVRIKTSKTASLPSAIVPSSAPIDTDRNSFQAHRRRSSEWHCITVPSSSASPQYVYVKRGSADVAICRDLSLKSLRSAGALVDAPITEAMSVLANLIHRCDEDIQPMVREAIKILSSSELYAPSITRFRDNDKIASGYYEGLIRLHQPSRHRKRSVVDAFRDHRATTVDSRPRRISSDIVNALENEGSWSFDVIALERITNNHALSHLGAKIYERWNVCETLHCSMDVVFKWLTVIEANYHHNNAYHNSTHAADVLQATSFFLSSEVIAQYVQDVHAVAALIAATVHDLDHPGRGNAFLMNTRHKLALLYNDHSVLESHHVALAFELTLAQPGINIFARLSREEFTSMRHAIIDMVLATDMSRHFEYLTKFQQLTTNIPDIEDNRDANSLTICRMLIKCADIANPCREWKLCRQWGMRIVEEYFEQTSEELEKKLPLTMKGFERENCNVPMTQCTFIDMFAREAFSSWCEFAELPQLLTLLEFNYDSWKDLSTTWETANNAKLL